MWRTFFDPLEVPFQGIATFPVPTAFLPGKWKRGQNIRVDDQSIAMRLPYGTAMPAAPGTGTFRGGILYTLRSDTLVGVEKTFCLVGMETGGVIKLWRNGTLDGGATWTGWLEVTQSSGKHGNTEMDPDFNGYLDFVYLPPGDGPGILDSQHRIIVQNGIDSPRSVDGEIAHSGVDSGKGAKIVASLPAPRALAGIGPTALLGTMFNLSGTAAASLTLTDSGANLVSSVPGAAATGYYWRFTAGAAPHTDGATSQIVFGSNHDLSGSRQLIVLATASDDAWLSCLKWDIVAGGNYYTIHDPENQFQSMFEVKTFHNTIRMFVFPLEDHAPNLTQATGIRLTLTRGTNAGTPQVGLPAASTLDIFMLAGSGNVQGGAQYSVSHRNLHSGSESPSVNLKFGDAADTASTLRKASGATVRRDDVLRTLQIVPQHGAQVEDVLLRGATVPGDFRLPLDLRVFYNYRVPVISPAQADGETGRIDCYIYRKDPGEKEYYLASSIQTNDYVGAPAWTFVSPFTAWKQKQYVTDNVASEARNKEATAPDAFNLPIPTGRGMLYANKRLYVAALTSNTIAAETPDVYESEDNNPMRFRFLPKADDPLSPGLGRTYKFTGDNVVAFRAMSASAVGASNVFAIGEKFVYAISGGRAFAIARVGTFFPHTVAERNGTLYIVDSEMNVRVLTGGIESISGGIIDDILTDVPAARRIFMSGVWYRDRYYLARSASGGTANTRVAVWNERRGFWESDDLCADTAVTPEQFVLWQDSQQTKLCFFAANGRLWQYEKPGATQDNATSIALAIRTGSMHTPDYREIRAGQATILATSKAGGTITVARHILKPDATATGTLSSAAGGSETILHREDLSSDGVSAPGGAGAAVAYEFSITTTYPFAFYRLGADVEHGGRLADVGQ